MRRALVLGFDDRNIRNKQIALSSILRQYFEPQTCENMLISLEAPMSDRIEWRVS